MEVGFLVGKDGRERMHAFGNILHLDVGGSEFVEEVGEGLGVAAHVT